MAADAARAFPPSTWRASLAEGFGTFALVFAGTGAVVVDAQTGALGHTGVALSFGLAVMAVIYSVGEVSGAHINPAVTIAFWAAGRFPAARVVPYALAQVMGALVASGLIAALFPSSTTLGQTVPGGTALQSGVLEGVLTFLLMFVILGVAVGAREVGLLAGVAIGGTVAFEALMGGPISGASMNPARSIGPAVIGAATGAGGLSALWVYLVGPTLGALLAVPAYRAVYGDRAPSPFALPL
ncbi:MIP/aquaporin family protein [Rubricoccus marinus]|uniref:Aquaporin n=1 Tax=Rubricoccus marinus TaxID=716817 RepID=A0A259U0L2_9BACT|nr:aquaporin [Rubricoccus marinus]OZC03563.1 aquaporin [Rubricoccus marinus]